MEIDITKLKSGIEEELNIDINYSFSKEELNNSGILELNNLKITGTICNVYDDYGLDLNVSGIMVLPCSVTLKPVNYKIDIKISGNMSEFTENFTNIENSIDIFPIIWENILMEIPLRVVSDDLSGVKTSGEGWQLITEKKEEVNPELEKLKDLL